jgi:hypothetical protein
MELARITATEPKSFSCKTFEIINHADGDENPERREKFSLLPEIRLARFPDDVGNVAHGFVDLQRARLFVLQKSKRRADDTNGEAGKQLRERSSRRKMKRPATTAG